MKKLSKLTVSALSVATAMSSWSVVSAARSTVHSHFTANRSIHAEITVALPGGDYLKFFQQNVIHGFHQEYPNIAVNFTEATNNGQLDTQIAAGNPPDINIGVWGYEPAKYAKMGKLVNIDGLAGAQSILNQIDPKFVVKNYGGVYYLPWNATTTMMVYNKQLFREAGLNPNKPPKTFTEFLRDAKKISSLPARPNGDKVYGTVFWNDALDWGGWYWSMLAPIYYNMNGGKYQLFNRFGTDIVFNQPAAKMKDFFQFSKEAQQFAPPNMKQDFFNRNIGMWLQFGYGWENNLLQAKDHPMVIGDDVGIAPVPVAKAGMRSLSTLDGRSIEIFKTTPDREEAAWDLAKFMMRSNVNLRACEQLHQLPTLKSLEHVPFFETADAKPFLNQSRSALIDEPFASVDIAEQAIEKAYVQSVLKGTISPSQAVVEAAQDARAGMTQN